MHCIYALVVSTRHNWVHVTSGDGDAIIFRVDLEFALGVGDFEYNQVDSIEVHFVLCRCRFDPHTDYHAEPTGAGANFVYYDRFLRRSCLLRRL